jgi:hypothetical protein
MCNPAMVLLTKWMEGAQKMQITVDGDRGLAEYTENIPGFGEIYQN